MIIIGRKRSHYVLVSNEFSSHSSFLHFSSIFDVIPSFLKLVFEADKPNVTNRTGWSKAREILSLVQSKQE